MIWPEIWHGTSIASLMVRAGLVPASWIYSLGWKAYAATYGCGLKRAQHPHCPIVCIGNLTVGGTGKTPLTLLVAETLESLGHRVVIGASGYGSPRSEAACLAPPGELDPAEWGDEPALYRTKRPSTPLIVGRRRVLAAEICAKEFPTAVLLMDDGLQHLPLKKDLSILVESPAKNRFCLPAGPYREPYARRSQADLRLGPDGEMSLRFRFGGVFDVAEQELLPQPVDLLCALGDPQRFLTSLREHGFEVASARLLPDHDPLTDESIFDGLGRKPLVVSEKDWVKLRRVRHMPKNILVGIVRYGVEVDGDLRGWLAGKVPPPGER